MNEERLCKPLTRGLRDNILKHTLGLSDPALDRLLSERFSGGDDAEVDDELGASVAKTSDL